MAYAQLVDTDHPQFRVLSHDTAVLLVTSDDPAFFPDEDTPEGWTHTGEIIDYIFQDGDFAEVYVFGRDA